jgi:hypothetical protein
MFAAGARLSAFGSMPAVRLAAAAPPASIDAPFA